MIDVIYMHVTCMFNNRNMKMKRILVNEDIWNLIVDHYAAIINPTKDDMRVQAWMKDKLLRQIRHDAYVDQKELEKLRLIEKGSQIYPLAT